MIKKKWDTHVTFGTLIVEKECRWEEMKWDVRGIRSESAEIV